MTAKKIVRCQRCGKRLKHGGDNYRLDCAIVADFDGYIENSLAGETEEIIEEIELSELTETELDEQVCFMLKQKLCRECREEIVNFLKGFEPNE